MKNREEIVLDAFRKLGIPGDGGMLSTDQSTAGVRAFTSMVKTFNAKHGMPLWKTDNYTFAMNLIANGIGYIGNTSSATLATSDQPIRINNVWRSMDGNTVPLNRRPNDAYTILPTSGGLGVPSEYRVEERKTSLTISIWPAPNNDWVLNGDLIIELTTRLTETITDSDSPDFPDHWEEALIYGLAERLSPEYGIALDREQSIQRSAKSYLDEALYEDSGDDSIFLRPGHR